VVLNPFNHPLGLFIILLAIALAGWLIYVFNRRVFQQAGLALDQAKRMALMLALFTAPYFYLLPVSLFV